MNSKLKTKNSKLYSYPGIGSASHKGTDKRGVDIWLITISRGFKPDGTQDRRRRQVHCSERELPHRIAMFYAEVHNAPPNSELRTSNSELTVAAWSEQYLATLAARCARGEMAERTLDGYRQHLRDRILPALGHIPLARLEARHVKHFLKLLEQDRRAGKNDRPDNPRPLSGSTRLRHFNTLRVMLQEAVYEEIIPANPAAAVRPPRADPPRPRYYTDDTLPLILAAADAQPPAWRAMIYCAVGLGLRRGELAGLRWAHIDWRRNTVTIEQAVQYRPGHGQQIKAPKTKRGYRVIPRPAP